MNRAALVAARDSARVTFEALEAMLESLDAQTNSAPAPAPTSAQPTAGLSNPAAFFDALRAGAMLGPKLSAEEVAGCEAIAKACAGKYPTAWSAYALATAFHETAGTMQPIKEIGSNAYFKRMYDIEGERPEVARNLGNLQPGDGAKFPGMGYVQSTGRRNARKATTELRAIGMLQPSEDIEQTPELLMRPDIAAAVLVLGMRDGWFTGKTLRDYIPAAPTRQHFINARRVVNGQDKADLIAGYAVEFMKALQAGDWK